MAKEMVLTNEQVERINELIWKIVWKKKKAGKFVDDVEDAHAECWVAVMEAIQRKGEVDYNYLASTCFNRLVDMVRKSVKNQFSTMDVSMFERIADSESRSNGTAKNSDSDYDTYEILTSRQERVEEHAELMGILDLFEGEVPDRAIDNWVAKILGYASSKSGGYAKLRDRVRNVIVAAGYYIPVWAKDWSPELRGGF